MARFLVSKGADVNAKTEKGFTACKLAEQMGKWEVARYLTSVGRRSESRSSGGCLVFFAVPGASLTAGICGLALFVTFGMF